MCLLSVALFARAWIEMIVVFWCFVPKSVALFARAWIEITSVINA